MQLRTDRRGLGHRGDRLGAEVLGVRTGEADALDALDATDRAQEVSEERPASGDVAPVGVDVLTEQRDLGDARRGEHLGLHHQVTERSTDLFTAHRRHDAVGTRVVTPGLDGDPRRERQLAHGIERRRHVAIRLGVRRVQDLDDRPLDAARSSSRGADARLWVPKTTSTQLARSTIW